VDGNGSILLVGGFAENGAVATVEIYDQGQDRWIAGPSVPLPLHHAMAATVNGVVYVIGGFTGDGTPSDRAFALRGGDWEELDPMPAGRGAGGAAAIGGRIYVAGGVAPSGLATSTFVFDPAAGSWSTAPGLLTPREHLGVTALDGKLYVVGGRVAGSNLPDAEVFDPGTGSWEALPDMPTARGGLAAAGTRNGFIVAPGGEDLAPGGSTYPQVEAFDIAAQHWVRLPEMPTPRHGLGVVAIGDTLYTLAGGPTPGLSFSGAVEAISLSGLDEMRCGGRPPTWVGSPAGDSITGTDGKDVVVALGGSDQIEGGAGADRLCGDQGRDRLSGGPGKDRLDGGPGRDRCVRRGRSDRLSSC
jgi:non-specific serine/threonine protein kinase